ncbi:MAG: S1C family serine protease [Alphaproteobacteria bacterium]|nr:S1C family serine protease [Alphaproteobacteria bacterium]
MWRLKAILKAFPLLMSLFMVPAHAENWVAIGVADSSGQTLYVDKDSIEKVGGFASFWIKMGIEKSLLSFNAYTDSIEQVVLNCEERTYAVSKILGVRSNGERVSLKEVAPAALSFAKVVDTSSVSNHWSQFCPTQVASVQLPVAQVNTPPAAPKPPEFSTGSGFFVTPDGYFVTNYHVIAGAEGIVLVDVNSKMHPATIVRIDKANDIAVLKADGKFKAIPVVTSRTAKRGQSVITVGYPHANIQGLEPKVTGGIINSLTGLNNDARTFQISVPLQSGNSGGPLVTLDGNVIGVVAMKLSALAMLEETGDLPQNVNYAVKSNYLTEVLIGIPGVERKLLQPSKRPYKDVAELTAVVEEATALVISTINAREN